MWLSVKKYVIKENNTKIFGIVYKKHMKIYKKQHVIGSSESKQLLVVPIVLSGVHKYRSFAKNERRFKMFERKSSMIPIFPAYQSYVIPDLPFKSRSLGSLLTNSLTGP